MKIDLFQKSYHILANTLPPRTSPSPTPSSGSFNIPITNPLTSVDTIPELINKILNIMVQIGLPLVGIFIIYCGFLFVTARGNEGKIEHAKTTLLYTVIGAAIVLGAFVISSVIEQTVGVLK